MIKNMCVRKLSIAFSSLFLITLIYLFPTNKESESPVIFKTASNSYVYLIDHDNYISRIDTYLNDDNIDTKIKNIVEILTINSNKKDIIKSGFSPVIPENTKIIDYSLKNNLLKINFTKEFLNIKESNEEKLIEALVYSLTEIPDINEIMIFIEGDKLSYLPHSKKMLPLTLTRDYGINKVFDLTNFKNITRTTVYYLNEYNNEHYYVPVSIYNNEDKDKIEIIIEELKTKTHSNNLMTYMASNLELEEYELLQEEIRLSFNEYILNSFNENEILEEVKYSILLSIKDNYNINNVIFNVNDTTILNFDLKTLE